MIDRYRPKADVGWVYKVAAAKAISRFIESFDVLCRLLNAISKI
jgi:hypothetical protein